MTCADFTAAITDYLEGSLELDERLQARVHLQVCAACRLSLLRMVQTLDVLTRLPRRPAPPAVRAELLARFRARSQRSA